MTLPKRIFVVDDEPVIAMSLALILRSNGMTVESFTRSTDALEAARLAPPDLLLSDVLMPVLSGVELARAITELKPECKVLLFSGQAGVMDLYEGGDSKGRFPMLAKPVHPQEILQAIAAMGFEFDGKGGG